MHGHDDEETAINPNNTHHSSIQGINSDTGVEGCIEYAFWDDRPKGSGGTIRYRAARPSMARHDEITRQQQCRPISITHETAIAFD